MSDPRRTVFLSYRREVSWAMAHLVRNDLVQHDCNVFMDVGSIDSGQFEPLILAQIEARTHFLVLLEPRSLDRIREPGDWLRREVAHALTHRRNVVPLLANGARMPHAADLPADVARLSSFNAVSVPHDYFAEAMTKLRDRFLSEPAPSPSADPAGSLAALRPSRPRRGPIAPALWVDNWGDVAELKWRRVDGADHYEVERSDTADFTRSTLVYRDTGAFKVLTRRTPSDHGWFRVRAVGVDDVSGSWSAAVEVFEES